MIQIVCRDFQTPQVPINEVLRYMRAGKEINDDIKKLAAEGIDRIRRAAICRTCYVRVGVTLEAGGEISLGPLNLESTDLSRRLQGCDEAFIFAASIGIATDRIIRAAEAVSPALSLACDAAGSALVEEVCERLCDEFASEVFAENKICVTRFSAGYGDLDINYQRDIAGLLKTYRNIGAMLTSGVMMSPTKTVTAIVGVRCGVI